MCAWPSPCRSDSYQAAASMASSAASARMRMRGIRVASGVPEFGDEIHLDQSGRLCLRRWRIASARSRAPTPCRCLHPLAHQGSEPGRAPARRVRFRKAARLPNVLDQDSCSSLLRAELWILTRFERRREGLAIRSDRKPRKQLLRRPPIDRRPLHLAHLIRLIHRRKCSAHGQGRMREVAAEHDVVRRGGSEQAWQRGRATR
jgi:hypothetical protein